MRTPKSRTWKAAAVGIGVVGIAAAIGAGPAGASTAPAEILPHRQRAPFRRDTGLTAWIGPETDGERETRRRVHRNTQAGDGWYRRMGRAHR